MTLRRLERRYEALLAQYEAAFLDGDIRAAGHLLFEATKVLRDIFSRWPEDHGLARAAHLVLAHLVEHGEAMLAEDDGADEHFNHEDDSR